MAKKPGTTSGKKAAGKRQKPVSKGPTSPAQTQLPDILSPDTAIAPPTTQSEYGARIIALEAQVQELRRQFIDLRDSIARGGAGEVLNCATVLQAARSLSNKILTPLDELRRNINPAGAGNVDQQLRECLTQLMEEGKVHLQEMKSEFQVRIRTDLFGGFKA